MVAELVLIGPRHALVRASKIIKDPNISELDKRLFYFDFIEECLMNGYALPEQFKEWGKALLSGAQLYEQEVYDLAFNEKNGLDHYNGLAKKLPLASYLRILILKLSQLSLGSEDKKELRKKLNLMISSLGEKDRNFWFRKIESIEMGLEVDLLLNERTKNIMFQRRQLDLSRKNISFQILQLLGQRATWDVEAVIESIWQSNYSIEHLNRLRMSVRRTNQLLCSLTENEKCIDLSGNSLSLKPNIKILSQRMDN